MNGLTQSPWLLQRNNNFIKGGRVRMLPNFFISRNPGSQQFYINQWTWDSSLNSYRVNVCGPLEVQLHWEKERERERERERESERASECSECFLFHGQHRALSFICYLCVSWLLSPAWAFFTKTKKILIISHKNISQNIYKHRHCKLFTQIST